MKKTVLSNTETAELCGSLALQLHAGLGLSDGLFLLAQDDFCGLKPLLLQLGHQLDSGESLSAAMESSGVFPTYATGLVRVGESSGKTEEALRALSEYYHERERINRQVKNALTYPAVILLLMLAVISVLLIKVLPVFDDVYASLGGRLTGIAGGLLYFGQALKAAMPVLLVVLAVIVCGVVLFSCVSAFRERLLSFWRKHRGDNGVSRKFNNSRFAQALSLGLRSGLSLDDSAVLASSLLSDVPSAAERCQKCIALLSGGVALEDALGQTGFLSASDRRMLSLGLRSGQGDLVMEDISRRLADEADSALEKLVSRVEPTMVLAASLLVGIVLLSVMIPLLNIISAIG